MARVPIRDARCIVASGITSKVSDEVKAAYGRSKLLALRRELMDKWATFLA